MPAFSEYSGEVIRSTLCDLREKYYESRGLGCYMFRMDNDQVVDATVKGNAARFINHSCDVSRKVPTNYYLIYIFIFDDSVAYDQLQNVTNLT